MRLKCLACVFSVASLCVNASSHLRKALVLNRENSPITYWIWTGYNICGMLKTEISNLLDKRQNKKPGEYGEEKSESK